MIAQLCLLADQWNFLALNEDVLHIRLHVQRIAIGNNDVAHLAHIERTQVLVHAPYLRGVNGKGLERFVGWQSKANSVTCCVWQVARLMRIIRSKRYLHAALGQLRRNAVNRVIPLRLFWLFVNRANDHGQTGGGDLIQQAG